jgi:threonine 3-dehydrogenase
MYAFVKQRREPKADLVTIDEPKIDKTEVLVKLEMGALCGTDIHFWDFTEWAQERVKKVPLIIGHEMAGKVVEVGNDVTTVQVGDLISAETHIVDNTCYQCQTGRTHVCQNMEILGVDRDGVFSEYVALPEGNAWVNDPSLPLDVASVLEPLGNAVQVALPRNNVEDIAGRTVAVLGCGPIGLFSIAVAQKLGAAQVFAVDIIPPRLELAKRLGADLVLNSKEEGEALVQTIRDATDGLGVDVVFEMAGVPATFSQAFDILTPAGRVALLGIHSGPFMFDPNKMVFKAATVHGISGRLMYRTWFQQKGLLKDLDFREKVASVITHKFPIHDLPEAFELLRSQQAGKVIVESKWE